MKRALLLLFGVIVGLPAISQVDTNTYGIRMGAVSEIWELKRVPVADGMIYRYKLHAEYDTAIEYITGIDTFEVTTTFRKISGNKPKPPLPDIITTVDDNVAIAPQAYFPAINAGDNIYVSNGWTHMKNQAWNAPHHDKTASFIDNFPGAYIELSCETCYKIEWWTEKRINHGIASVSVDGGTAVDIDLYDPRTDNNSLLVWSSSTLMNAAHKVRINFTGRKNTAATATNILHDKFVIIKKQ